MQRQFFIVTGLCLGICAVPAVTKGQNKAQKPATPAKTLTASRLPPLWPVFVRLPHEFQDAAQLAKWITDFSAQKPGTPLALALSNPPAVAEVAKLLPSGSIRSGDNRVTLATGAAVTLVKIRPEDTQAEAFKKAFAFLTVSREQLVNALKGLPSTSVIRVEQPGRHPAIVTRDVPRAIQLVRASPSGTSASAKWSGGGVRYPRVD